MIIHVFLRILDFLLICLVTFQLLCLLFCTMTGLMQTLGQMFSIFYIHLPSSENCVSRTPGGIRGELGADSVFSLWGVLLT